MGNTLMIFYLANGYPQNGPLFGYAGRHLFLWLSILNSALETSKRWIR